MKYERKTKWQNSMLKGTVNGSDDNTSICSLFLEKIKNKKNNEMPTTKPDLKQDTVSASYQRVVLPLITSTTQDIQSINERKENLSSVSKYEIRLLTRFKI